MILSEREFREYLRMREWRKIESDKRNSAPFTILTNAQLAEVVQQRPKTLADLEKVKGIGKKRLEDHGEAILKVLSLGDEANGTPD